LPLISICIPTYNQPQRLELLLKSILSQYSDFLEVIVCDDSQNNLSDAIVKAYKQEMPIKYIHRKERSIDTALLDLFEMASGDYVWWIGDDILMQNAIEEIYKILVSNKELIFLWVNSADECDPSLTTFQERGLKLFNDRNELLKYDIGLLGFITATIFKRSAVSDSIPNAKKFIGTSFVSLFIVLCAVIQPGIYAIYGNPCFVSAPKPSGEVRWYDQTKVFGINLYQVAINFSFAFDGMRFNKALSKNLSRVLRAVLYERAKGYRTGFGSNTFRIIDFLRCYYDYWIFWLYFPVLLLPRFMIRWIYIAFTNFKIFIAKK
jgi:abequosyltransferase